MARTSTRTKTRVYIIGDDLAANNESLRKAAEKMKEIETKYETEIHRAGVRLQPTDEHEDLSTIRMQWRDVMKMVIPGEELTEINELLARSEDPEPGAEMKFDKLR